MEFAEMALWPSGLGTDLHVNGLEFKPIPSCGHFNSWHIINLSMTPSKFETWFELELYWISRIVHLYRCKNLNTPISPVIDTIWQDKIFFRLPWTAGASTF